MSEITTKAQELLAGRVASVEELERRRNEVGRLREALQAAERGEAEAWSAATSAGWSAAELKRLGFSQPPTRRGGRPARKTAARKSSHTHTEGDGQE
ncbi:hypothetical protein EU513_15180 [Yimella sp. RIT 621]|uniref:hypothetical protein n=1 Tax=Yimella TaxID=908935 RepID=UPI00101C96D4|nr:hypothetical protein [Yimella sp. RIT 621]RYG75835.1 hypothetical protein EU513_15180 [Yimella sp. RIT 621]